MPTFAETGNISRMMSRTGRFFCILIDTPKSPCSRFPRYFPSCTISGWSSPYFAFSASIVAWDGVFSDSHGFPGMAFIRKKVMQATTSSVNSAITTRFAVYFAISSLPISVASIHDAPY